METINKIITVLMGLIVGYLLGDLFFSCTFNDLLVRVCLLLIIFKFALEIEE